MIEQLAAVNIVHHKVQTIGGLEGVMEFHEERASEFHQNAFKEEREKVVEWLPIKVNVLFSALVCSISLRSMIVFLFKTFIA